MPNFESDFAILDFAWLLGELPETWTAPEIYLTALNLQKIYRKLSVSVSRFTYIQVTLEVQQRDQDATVREQHRNLRRAPHGRRSPDQMHPPGPVRTFRAFKACRLIRLIRLMACCPCWNLGRNLSILSILFGNFEEQLHASKLQRPPGLCRIGMAMWVLHCWLLLHLNE